MAREVVISFATRALDKARAASQAIQRSLKDAVRSATDPEVKAKLRNALREEKRAGDAQIAAERKRLEGLRQIGAGLNQDEGTPTAQAARRLERQAGRLEAALNGSTGAIARGAIQALGPAGFAVALAAQLVGALKEQVDKQIREAVESKARELEATIRRREWENDYERRTREDPLFARREARRAWLADFNEEAERARQHRTGTLRDDSLGGL